MHELLEVFGSHTISNDPAASNRRYQADIRRLQGLVDQRSLVGPSALVPQFKYLTGSHELKVEYFQVYEVLSVHLPHLEVVELPNKRNEGPKQQATFAPIDPADSNLNAVDRA